MDLGLKHRVAIVAASSQGIGKATAEAFAAEGCRVAICARDREALQGVADTIHKQHKVEAYPEAFDVTDAAAVKQFVEHVVAKFGSADICVTNAGGPPAKGFRSEERRVGKECSSRSSARSRANRNGHMKRS